MWQTGGGAKQPTLCGGPSLTEDSQTERERQRSVYTSFCIMLTTSCSQQIAQTAKKKQTVNPNPT